MGLLVRHTADEICRPTSAPGLFGMRNVADRFPSGIGDQFRDRGPTDWNCILLRI